MKGFRVVATGIIVAFVLAGCAGAPTSSPPPTPRSPVSLLAGTWTDATPVKFTTLWDVCGQPIVEADTEEWTVALIITRGSDDSHVTVQMRRTGGTITSSNADCYNHASDGGGPVTFALAAATMTGIADSNQVVLTDPATGTAVADCTFAGSVMNCSSFVWKATHPVAAVPGQTTTTETFTSGMTLALAPGH